MRQMPRIACRFVPLAMLLAPLAGCTLVTPGQASLPTPTATPASAYGGQSYAYTPQELRDIFGFTPLLDAGDTGQGQTVVLIESYGDPSLQQDLATFDSQYGLPPITPQVIAPLGSVPFDQSNTDMQGWAGETAMDAEIVHALAPGAGIVVLTSPVDETEGTIGLPQFLRLEQYAVAQHLGSIISQSWGASEYTLRDSAGQAEIAQWDQFFHQATTQDGITFFASSGDDGATDYANLQMTHLVNARTSAFPADDPWVTVIGGTTVYPTGSGGYSETAWNDSEGGFSAFFSQPSYQKALPAAIQRLAHGERGIPDVAAPADPRTGLGIFVMGQAQIGGGTSAGAPFWAALTAIADQRAGHPLGFLNPALYAIGGSAKTAHDFFDVTSGNNSIHQDGAAVTGYSAGPGWDPVTGWGAPDVARLVPDLIAASAP